MLAKKIQEAQEELRYAACYCAYELQRRIQHGRADQELGEKYVSQFLEAEKRYDNLCDKDFRTDTMVDVYSKGYEDGFVRVAKSLGWSARFGKDCPPNAKLEYNMILMAEEGIISKEWDRWLV